MKFRCGRFNIILTVFLLYSAFLTVGCKTTEEKQKAKLASMMSFHLEVNPDGTSHNAPVPVYREHPMYVNVQKEPFLDPGFMQDAAVVDVPGEGFAIKIVFDPPGRRRLENITTSYKGQHIAILCKWTETRWLAAPRINKRITDGVFIFTPDCTRLEAERIVDGLKNVIKKAKQNFVF